MPRPWRGSSACRSSPGTPSSMSSEAVPGRAAEIGLPAWRHGRPCRVLSAAAATPDVLLRPGCRAAGARHRGRPGVPALHRCERWRCASSPSGSIGPSAASSRIGRRAPPARPPRPAQMLAATIPVGLLIGGFAVVPDATYAALTALIAIPFLCVTLLRAGGAAPGAGRLRSAGCACEWPQSPAYPDWLLPVYTVLVPLVREANVLPDLVAIAARPRLSRRQARDLSGAGGCRRRDAGGRAGRWRCRATSASLVVPDRAPHTKPKALNYALQFARGEFVVVYDAEDRPQPDQLRRAWEVFRHAPAGARLPAGAAQHLQSAPELAHPPVHDRVFRPVRCHPAGARAAAAAGAAGRHVEPFSARHADRASAPGTPTTSPRTPTSASAWRGRAIARACWDRRRGRRRRRSSASGSSSARAGSRAGCRPISCTPATSAGSTAIWAGARRSAFMC